MGPFASVPRCAAPQPITTRREFLGTLAAGIGSSMLLGRAPAAMISQRVPGVARVLPTGLIFDPICKRHLTPPGKPERPERYDAVLGALQRSEFFPALLPCKPRPASQGEILACHSAGYLALAEREILSGAPRLSTGDTCICRDSWLVAHYAAGAACSAVDTVLGGQCKNAFCLSRPPGHHATFQRGMGFCVFNNAAIAARYAQRKFGVGKVLVIDWDLHHGNGTQDIFYDDPSVFFFSTHQSPLYPWTGRRDETGHGKGLGTTLNCPLAAGAGRKEFDEAFQGALLPAMDRYRPELIILSAGFDARLGDPLGRLRLVDQDYVDLTGMVLNLARRYANGHVISLLEGGYSLSGLAAGATAHVGRLQAG